MRMLACLLTAVAFTAVACGSGSGGGTPSPTPTATSGRIASTAKLTIVSPTPGQSVSTNGVLVKISLQEAVIVKQVSTNIKPNEGHIHLRIDGTIVNYLGSAETPTGKLSPGPHLIEVEFVAADHGPFYPRVVQQVTVTAA